MRRMVSDGLNDNRRVKNAQKVRKRIVTWEGKPANVDGAAMTPPNRCGRGSEKAPRFRPEYASNVS
jgi:hypothetical protein